MATLDEKQFLIEVEGDHSDAGLTIDPAGVEVFRRVEQSRLAKTKISLTAAFVFAVVGLASFALAWTRSGNLSNPRSPFRDLQDDDTDHARQLTTEYIRARFASNVPAIQAFHASNSTLSIDLSDLDWHPAYGIKAMIPLQLSGPAEIAKYYNAFRMQSKDGPPEQVKLECVANTCVTHETVQRAHWTINTKAVINWNAEDKIESLQLKLSSPEGEDKEAWQKKLLGEHGRDMDVKAWRSNILARHGPQS